MAGIFETRPLPPSLPPPLPQLPSASLKSTLNNFKKTLKLFLNIAD